MKASGNKLEYSLMPFMALNQKTISALTSGDVPDLVFMDAPETILPQNAWDDKLVDVSDVVAPFKVAAFGNRKAELDLLQQGDQEAQLLHLPDQAGRHAISHLGRRRQRRHRPRRPLRRTPSAAPNGCRRIRGADVARRVAEAIAGAADKLTAVSDRDGWQRVQLGRLLEDIVAEGATAGVVTQTALALPEIRALLADRLRGRPTRANFRTGHLTICTLVPMRSVPSGRLPDRPRRRGLPSADGARRRRSSSSTLTSATVTLVARTASCSSMPSWPRPSTW